MAPVSIGPFGVIPKGSQPETIFNLSSPHGSSVNNVIDKRLASLSYLSVDEVACMILELGAGSEMAKLDIKSAHLIMLSNNCH